MNRQSRIGSITVFLACVLAAGCQTSYRQSEASPATPTSIQAPMVVDRPAPPPLDGDAAEKGHVFTVKLTDGSRLVGAIRAETFAVQSKTIGKVSIDIGKVIAIEFPEDGPTATISLRNGDIIHGELLSGELAVRTFLGPIGVPIQQIRGIGAGAERPSNVQVIHCPDNDHSYAVIDTPMAWEEARAHAERLSIPGTRAHLATITTASENTWIMEHVIGEEHRQTVLWIGAFQAEGSEPDGGWRWVTGEEWLWTNWHPDEPNNSGQEDYAEYVPYWGNGEWNDVHDQALPLLVEFEPEAEPGAPERLRVIVELDDGSRIVGRPVAPTVRVRNDLIGETDAFLKDILCIEFSKDRKTALVTSRQGDMLTVELGLEEFKANTSFGTISLPLDTIKAIRDPSDIRPQARKGQAVSPLPSVYRTLY